MSKIGILGGSFDPPHFGHLKLATTAKEHLGLDEVWFIPVYISPFKLTTPPADPWHRLAMCTLLVEQHPDFKVLDFEILKKAPSYTVESLEYLKKKYPEHQFYLLVGQDALDHFLQWKNPEEIVKMVTLAVAPRQKDTDFSFLKKNPAVFKAAQDGLLPMPLTPISSTVIRETKGNLDEFVPKKLRNIFVKINSMNDGKQEKMIKFLKHIKVYRNALKIWEVDTAGASYSKQCNGVETAQLESSSDAGGFRR